MFLKQNNITTELMIKSKKIDRLCIKVTILQCHMFFYIKKFYSETYEDRGEELISTQTAISEGFRGGNTTVHNL